MSTTCNTLPSLDDPSLNSPTITARLPHPNEQMYYRSQSQTEQIPDLNDPEIMAQLDKTQSIPDTFQARTALLLPFERGLQLMRCKHGGFVFRYLDGSRRWRQAFACNQKILCQECAMDQAIEQFSKYRSLIDFLPAQHFTRFAIALDPDSPADSFDAVMSFLDRTLPGIPIVAKAKPSQDCVEILYCGELTQEQATSIQTEYPASRPRRWHSSHFIRELHRVLDADTYQTPESAVLADSKYKDIRILRVHGLSQQERKKLLHTTPICNNFPEPSQKVAGESHKSPMGNEYSPSDPSHVSELPTLTTEPATYPSSPAPAKAKSYFHRTTSGRLMLIPPCPCGCGSAPISFAAAKSKDDNSPDLKWIDINLVTKEESVQ